MKGIRGLLAGAVLIVAAACTSNQKPTNSMESKAINPEHMNTEVDPGDDFYRYANGRWMDNNPIPGDKSRYGAFDELQEMNDEKIRALIDKLAAEKGPEGSLSQKIGDFYAAGMDTETLNNKSYEPLMPYLQAVRQLQTPADMMQLLGQWHQQGMAPLFYLFVTQDRKNSEQMIASFYQGGLSLPDKSYYEEAPFQEYREAFRQHVRKMFQLIGVAPEQAKAHAQVVFELETQLAAFSMTRKERRNPEKTYHYLTPDELQQLTPALPWQAFWDALGQYPEKGMNVAMPGFMEQLSELMEQTPMEQWQVLLEWKLLNVAAPYLSEDFEQEHFAFYGQTLQGKEEMRPRWQRVLDATSGAMGMALGKLYVEEYFPARSKERMLKLITNLKKAYAQRMQQVAWMTPETREKALDKLKSMGVKVGYPDKWRSYEQLGVTPGDYFGNVIKAREFNTAYNLNKMDQPVDPDEWFMTPQTVNAYYSPNRNEIVFPAAILQPPFFFPEADDAVNYGAIGVVIGHEMTHGFDDQGRRFDKQGNMNNWWTKTDAENFSTRTQLLVEHFNAFQPNDSMHLDGELTLGENIADNGGLNIAYDALQLAQNGEPQSPIDGFTPDQRFFLAYAQIWRQNIRDEELKRRLKVDVHSPGEYRVNGGVFNIPAFYRAFAEVGADDALYRPQEQRAQIW